MNEARFVELLAAYGAELSRWPEEERGAAEALLEVASHRIKDIWESERVFDHLLAMEKDAPASIALETHVLSAAPQPRSVRQRVGLFAAMSAPKWATGGVIAASLALGFAAGYAGEPQAQGASEVPEMLAFSETGSASLLLSPEAEVN
jgi:hypothetical protein